ncbi:hypothetical protein [Pandoraea eparura]|uniref:hypothetical protein n=1 Tax=Pandoraea eparura TaxID=2508291 RepID=UPI001C2D4DBD|nr:hypothetical protein [Pandoraea eparura]
MPFEDDGDVVRGLGQVALQAAYVEEAIDACLEQFIQRGGAEERLRRLTAREKARTLRRLLNATPFSAELDYLPALLDAVVDLLERRNVFLHGRLYANGPAGTLVRRSGRRNMPDAVANSAELYDLANELYGVLPGLMHASTFRLPRHLMRRDEF